MKLKDALTRQFGEKARGTVESMVDAHLGGSKGQIGRQDIDTIEASILSSMRTNRGSIKTYKNTMSKSASLPMASSRSVSTQGLERRATVGAFPPATPVQIPKVPIGTSNPGGLVRAASDGKIERPALTTGPKLKPRRPAPYGESITGTNTFVDESARSGVKMHGGRGARYPVPIPPKLKPMDHWDLIVAFDSAKYRAEEEAIVVTGHYQDQRDFKKTLDDQMLEIRENQDNEAAGKEEERLLMDAQIEENKKYKYEEEALHHRKKHEQGAINESMLGDIIKYRQRDADRKAKECEEMTRWLGTEKARREEEEKAQAIEYANKCAWAKQSLEAARLDREERKRADEENEKRLMKIRDQIADEQEAKKQKIIKDRKDKMDKIEATMGGAVAARDAKDASDLEAKIKRVQEESALRATVDARNRADTHERKVKDMMACRREQIAGKGRDEADQKIKDKITAEGYKKECADAEAAEKAKQERMRKAREEQDQVLIAKIRTNAGIHPQHVMMTPRNKTTELGYNKAIFEQMMKESFMEDAVTTLHAGPSTLHHPEGKLCPYPTIPRYTGEIHPIELEAPDV